MSTLAPKLGGVSLTGPPQVLVTVQLGAQLVVPVPPAVAAAGSAAAARGSAAAGRAAADGDELPVLRRGAVAVVNLDGGAIGGRGRGHVDAAVGVAVAQALIAVAHVFDRVGLRAGAVAVPQLHWRAVGGAGRGDVDALVRRRVHQPHFAAAQVVDAELLRARLIARVLLDLRAVAGAGGGDVEALGAALTHQLVDGAHGDRRLAGVAAGIGSNAARAAARQRNERQERGASVQLPGPHECLLRETPA